MWGTASADQFAHPLPEDVIWILDTDPVLCAQALGDTHLASCFVACCRVLARAWKALQPDAVSHEWGLPAERLPGNLQHLHQTLGGMPLAQSEHTPYDAWVQELGGNYLWVYALGQSIALEHAYRFGGVVPGLLMLYACEAVPLALQPTLNDWSLPVPVVASDCVVTSGDVYDTVASCRADYCRHRLNGLLWTTDRDFPTWMEETQQ